MILIFKIKIKKKLAWRMIVRKLVVLKNVFVIFDSVERHLVKKYFATLKKVSASYCKSRVGTDHLYWKSGRVGLSENLDFESRVGSGRVGDLVGRWVGNF